MITLDRLVNVLGGYGARLTHPSVPRSAELRSVALPETRGGRAVPGDVLLAVDAPDCRTALRWARAADAVVVLVRDDAGCDPDTGGVAVVAVDPDLAWSEVAAVVYGLVLEGRETESGRGPTDLFALADSLAGDLGRALLIAGRRGDVQAYSRVTEPAGPVHAEMILGRRLPAGYHETLSAAASPVFLPGEPSGWMSAPARAGRTLLGSVWVPAAEPLGGDAAGALSAGAGTVALHLLRSQASADLERQVEADLVAHLLDGAADAGTLASRLGLPQHDLRVVAVRADHGGDRHAALLQAFERMTAGFGWSRPGRSTLAETTAYTVLPAADAGAARAWLDGLVAALPAGMSVRAGISAPAGADELGPARREADECLALGEALGERGGGPAPPPAYDESWDDVLLGRLRSAARLGRRPARGPVDRLREHDTRHGTPYLVTLRAWLHAQGDPAAAGTALGVHENTVRYRLRRMAEITDLPLADPGKRLAMMVELAITDD